MSYQSSKRPSPSVSSSDSGDDEDDPMAYFAVGLSDLETKSHDRFHITQEKIPGYFFITSLDFKNTI